MKRRACVPAVRNFAVKTQMAHCNRKQSAKLDSPHFIEAMCTMDAKYKHKLSNTNTIFENVLHELKMKHKLDAIDSAVNLDGKKKLYFSSKVKF